MSINILPFRVYQTLLEHSDGDHALPMGELLRLLRTEDAILASWPRQDVEKYLDLTERFLNALRKEAEKL